MRTKSARVQSGPRCGQRAAGGLATGSVFAATWTYNCGQRAAKERLHAAVLTKLNTTKGGGFIFSPITLCPRTSPTSYDYVVRLVREHGVYPLQTRRVRFARPRLRILPGKINYYGMVISQTPEAETEV